MSSVEDLLQINRNIIREVTYFHVQLRRLWPWGAGGRGSGSCKLAKYYQPVGGSINEDFDYGLRNVKWNNIWSRLC